MLVAAAPARRAQPLLPRSALAGVCVFPGSSRTRLPYHLTPIRHTYGAPPPKSQLSELAEP